MFYVSSNEDGFVDFPGLRCGFTRRDVSSNAEVGGEKRAYGTALRKRRSPSGEGGRREVRIFVWRIVSL